jgi:pantothenate kinase
VEVINCQLYFIIGTLIGLSKLLINVDNYTEIMSLAQKGNNGNVDLLVKDIYGGGASNIGLHKDIIASSFGKISDLMQNKNEIKKEDVAKSLLTMICFHIGQLAYLVGKNSNIKR